MGRQAYLGMFKVLVTCTSWCLDDSHMVFVDDVASAYPPRVVKRSYSGVELVSSQNL